ncbi:MAG: thiol-disulfide isomerase/thioredoxin [Myxococcota bacterium]|jgi:thiol-disulfide isomerase/thioredoxin
MLAILPVVGACTHEHPLYGPENGWFRADIHDMPDAYIDGSVAVGMEQGDVAPNFRLRDQFGEEVELYQFYGKVVQISLFAAWCPPCWDDAPLLAAASRDLEDNGAIVVEVMLESIAGTAEVIHCARWAERHGADHPILADTDFVTGPLLQGGFPTLPLLDRQLRFADIDAWPLDVGRLENLAVTTQDDM